MAIYAISDLHLSFGVDKPMNIFGKIWEEYEDKISQNWINTVKDTDTVIIPGDISWAISFKEAVKDFAYINALPGKKIFSRGNHDYYFSTKTKVDTFLKENDFNTISVLHNNAYEVEEYVICGTRGWGKTENSNNESDKKIIAREEIRLKLSLDAGIKLKKEKGLDKKILVAMHFPPFIPNFQNILQQYSVSKCIYGHLHGFGHSSVIEGNISGIEYVMVSCDYTKFNLIKL